jgi:Iap family predicted aminopeptidase
MRRLSAFAVLLPVAFAQERLEFHPLPQETVVVRLGRFHRQQDQRYARIRELFQEAGCSGENLRDQPVKGQKLPNIICTLDGSGGGEIVVGAHYDSDKAGEGVADNWSGAALLVSLYESTRKLAPTRTFRFVAFSAEEKGLHGSEEYVRRVKQGELPRPAAMLNLDTLGLTPTKIWTSHADPTLASRLAQLAATLSSSVETVNLEPGGTADSESFRKANIPSMTIHSVTQDTLGILHSKQDTPAAVNWDHYYATYRLVTAYLALLDRVRWEPVQ